MNEKFTYAAFYDLDHTILKVNSATYLVEEARRRGLMSDRKYRHAIYLSILYKLGLGEPSRMIGRMLTWLKGLREDTVHSLCREVFDGTLRPFIRPEILQTMEDHRRKGGANILLSSATLPICRAVNAHLELDDVICTCLASEEGILTGATCGKLVYGKEKEQRMLEYCHLKGYDPAESYYYGDSHTDQHVMRAVGQPVAVSPDKRLLKIALELKWPILVRDRA